MSDSGQEKPLERIPTLELVNHLTSFLHYDEIAHIADVHPGSVRRWEPLNAQHRKLNLENEARLREFGAVVQFIGANAVPPATDTEVASFFRSFRVDPQTMETESYLSLYLRGERELLLGAARTVFNIAQSLE